VNGLRDSTWTTFDLDGLKKYEEFYDNGKFLRGVAWEENGTVIEYDVIQQNAEPIGGLPEMYKLVTKNIKYPKAARKEGLQGRVYVQFIVEKDGALSDIRSVKPIGGGCDEEAERVLALTKWKPAKVRGKLVRQKMVLPISFKLG
jgi:protein TonB